MLTHQQGSLFMWCFLAEVNVPHYFRSEAQDSRDCNPGCPLNKRQGTVLPSYDVVARR